MHPSDAVSSQPAATHNRPHPAPEHLSKHEDHESMPVKSSTPPDVGKAVDKSV